VDTVACQEASYHLIYPEEILNGLIPIGALLQKPKLKVGAVFMLLQNLMPSQGLYSGTSLTIFRDILEAHVIEGLNLDTVLRLSIFLIPSDMNLPFRFKIRRGFYMTINKPQGQTRVEICL
jgi:hypothetical protein